MRKAAALFAGLAYAASVGAFMIPQSSTFGRKSLRMAADGGEAKPMTLTEKILAKASGKTSVAPNDNIWVNADNLMTHDVCGPGTFGIFKKEFGENAKVRKEEGCGPISLFIIITVLIFQANASFPLFVQVWDKERVVIIPDHYIFTADPRANRNVDILRDFVKEQNIK